MSFAHLDAALAEVDELARRFTQAGHRLYLVGGIVRDQWLDEPIGQGSDIDLTTDALPDAIKAIVEPCADALWTQGERFGTIGLRIDGRAFEITTHRVESYADDSRKPQVTFGDEIEVDLSRRDFTVNAMAIELPSGDLIDPWGGAADLASRWLRTPLSPDISFNDDPLRMLRAARFLTKYALTPTNELTASARSLHERIRIVAIERIGDEITRLLSLDDPTPGLHFLAEIGLLAEVLCYGEPAGLATTSAGLADGIEICGRVVGEPAESRWRRRLAGLLTGVYSPLDEVHAATRRLRGLPRRSRAVVGLVRSSRAVIQAPSIEPPVLRRWAADASDADGAISVARAVTADPDQGIEAFALAFAELRAAENLDDPDLIDGQGIMALLDVSAGPVIGEALGFLHDRYLDHGPLSRSAQQDLLRDWWAGRTASA